MNIFDLKLFTICAVLFSTITATIIVSFDVFNEKEKHQRLKVILLLYFCSHIVTDFGYLCYFYFSTTFIWINWLFFLGMLFVPVFFYELIFNITTTSPDEKFSKFHYATPVLLSVCMLALSVVTPFEEQLKTVQGNGTYRGDSFLFFIFSNKHFFRIIFNVLYIVLTFMRLPAYRRYVINYSANETKSSLRWVNILLFFMIGLMLIPFYGLFINRSELASAYITYFQSGSLLVQYGFLTFHVVKRHYILQEPRKKDELPDKISLISEEQPGLEEENLLKKSALNKNTLNDYMNEHKPYLDANLKITDLAESLGINRTYLSSFINSEFGVNFSTYINQYRYDEYETKRQNKMYESLTNSELAEKVGFGSYRSYTRFAAKA